jgi:hypothetical protein
MRAGEPRHMPYLDLNKEHVAMSDAMPDTSYKREKRFRKYLEGFGLQEYEQDILVERLLNRKTFQQIKKDGRYTSTGAAFHIYSLTLARVKRFISKRGAK